MSNRKDRINHTLLIAHRGASTLAPENTLSAIQLAWQQDADAVEVDVHLTGDGRIVVIHDADTRRMSGVKRIIKDHSYRELQSLNFGEYENEAQHLPLLEEVLSTIPSGKTLFIEIKCGTEIVPVLKTLPLAEHRIKFISFDYQVAVLTKKLLARIPFFLLAEFENDMIDIDLLLKKVSHGKLDGLDLEANRQLNQKLVDRIHKAGFKVYVWTVDDLSEVRRYRTMGIDGITTNRIGWMKRQLEGLS